MTDDVARDILRLARAYAHQHAARYGLDAEDAESVAAQAMLARRPQWEPGRASWSTFARLIVISAFREERRALMARRRGGDRKAVALVEDPAISACPAPEIQDAIVTVVRQRAGVPAVEAEVFAAWLGGEGLRPTAARTGLNPNFVHNARHRVRVAMGFTSPEVRALIAHFRGERLVDVAFGSWRPCAGGSAPSGGRRKTRRERERVERANGPRLSASRVCQLQKRALAKLRGGDVRSPG